MTESISHAIQIIKTEIACIRRRDKGCEKQCINCDLNLKIDEVIEAYDEVIHLMESIGNNMYECFHCGQRAVIWDADFSFEDYAEEGEGIIHECHCSNCGAKITYRVSVEDDEPEADI